MSNKIKTAIVTTFIAGALASGSSIAANTYNAAVLKPVSKAIIGAGAVNVSSEDIFVSGNADSAGTERKSVALVSQTTKDTPAASFTLNIDNISNGAGVDYTCTVPMKGMVQKQTLIGTVNVATYALETTALDTFTYSDQAGGFCTTALGSDWVVPQVQAGDTVQVLNSGTPLFTGKF